MQKKSNAIAVFVIAALMFVGAVVCFILWGVLDDKDTSGICLFFAIILALSGVIILIAGIVGLKNAKIVAENMADPATLCHQTYGNGGNYTYFLAYPDKKSQDSSRTTTNVVGALTFIFLGVGFFSTGAETVDLFVSPEEIVINSKKKNPKLYDAYYGRIPAAAIADIKYRNDNKKYQGVRIELTSGEAFIYDISLKNYDARMIYDTFSKLLVRPSVQTEEEQPSQGSVADGVFDI